MPRVLIVADLFPPGFGPRPGALSKYLPVLGWEVDIVAFDRPGDFALPGAISKEKVTWVKKCTISEEISSLKKWPDCLRLINPLRIELIREGLTLKILQNVLLKRIQIFNPDIIFATTCGSVALIKAVATAAKIYNKPWVGDVRDLLIQTPAAYKPCKTRFHHWAATRRLLQILPSATAVSTISVWHKNFIEKKIRRHVDLVFNGYDPELFDPYKNDFHCDKFRITFTGTFACSKNSGGDIFFAACSKLIKQGVINKDDLEICIYAHDGSIEPVQAMAKNYNIENEVFVRQQVSHTEVPRVLQNSAILLHVTIPGGHGIMGTKTYEYLASRKPILSIPKDDGSVGNLLLSTKAGVIASTIDEVAYQIKLFYEKWKNGMPLQSEITEEQRCQFSRKAQAEHFSKIFRRCISAHSKIAT